jgi:serine/threonine protein kinase
VTAPHLAPGQQVAGRYYVRALLGFTGEAASYQATASSGHEVVLKLYDPAIGQRADVMAQLERVRAVLATLPPELVVPILDFGYDVNTSAPFSVCEKLQLPSLAKLVETGPLSAEVVGTVLVGIGRALDAAQAQHLFHLALKPSNVFVGPAPEYAVRICDFGASVVRSTSPTHESYAQSAPWWAPEQLQPSAVIGAPADVFAAALIAFHALAGRSYWRSCQSSPPDLPNWQIEVMGARTPFSQRAAELGVVVNGAVDGVFARALSVNQPERPRTVGALGEVLLGAGGRGHPYVNAYAAGNPPETSKTLALPEMGGYPPVAAYGAPPPPMPSDGYTAAAPAPPYQEPAPPQATPGLPPFPQPVKKKGGAMAPVIIGVAAALLVGGVVVAVLFPRMAGQDKGDTQHEPSAVAVAEEPAASASPTGADSATTAASSASPTASASAGGGGAGAADAQVELTLRCVPQCDVLLVDNRAVEKLEEKNKLSLLPGRHTIEARKAGYLLRKETIELELGKPQEKDLFLAKLGSPPPPATSKKCGQFIKCR